MALGIKTMFFFVGIVSCFLVYYYMQLNIAISKLVLDLHSEEVSGNPSYY